MSPARSYSPSDRTTVLAAAAVLAVALALRAPLLAGGQIDYDEGVYWQSLRALAAGSPLFTAVYSSQPPAFLVLLLPGHLLLGGGLVGDRLTVLVLALAGIAAAGRTAGLLGGRWAGLLAAALLAADPLYLRQSVTLQADGPAVALGLVALAAAAESRVRPAGSGLALAGASGAALAVAVLTKLLALAAGPALLVLLLAPGPPVRALPRLGAAGLGGGLATAAMLLPFAGAWPDLWQQVVGLHLGARALPLGGLDAGTVLGQAPFVVAAAAGGLVAFRRAPLLAAAGAAWAGGAALLMAVQHPLWPHHAVVMVAPLALLGGGLALLAPARIAALACLAALAASVLSCGGVRAMQQPPSVDAPVVAALRGATGPGDLVVTDDQFVAALAGRSVPPELVDTSFVRVDSGDLTAAEVETVAGRPGVRAILFSSGRLDAVPGLRAWVAVRFPRVVDLGGSRTLYTR
jgi:hypothetical protein